MRQLKEMPAARVVLTGYTSSEGEAVDNYGLAMMRAKKVMELLISLGIAAERFEIKSLGANEPVASNETEDGRTKNRRVTLQIIP